MTTAAAPPTRGIAPARQRPPRPGRSAAGQMAAGAVEGLLALVLHDRDYPVADVLGALVRSGFHVSERNAREVGGPMPGLLPSLVVAAIVPGQPGSLELLRELDRSPGAVVAVLAPSPEGTAEALSAGADVVLVDADGADVFAAQFSAIHRRADRERQQSLQRPLPGGLVVDVHAHLASYGGVPLRLTAMEFRMLQHLQQHQGETCSAEQIFHAAKGERQSPARARELLKPHMFRLRRELARAAPGRDLIVNLRNVGYRLEAGA